MSCEVRGCHEGGCTIPECRERKQEFEDRMREKKARHQAWKHAAASGSGGHGVPREAHPEPLQTDMDLDDQHRGRIRKREEEEETTALQDADPGGEMTAEVGTTSEAMNVEMVDLWEDVVDTQQEQEVLKHVAEIFVGSEADDDGESGWAWDDVHGKFLDLSKVREARQEEIEYLGQGRQGRVLQQDWQEASFCEKGGYKHGFG